MTQSRHAEPMRLTDITAIWPMVNVGRFRVMRGYLAVVSILMALGCAGCGAGDTSEPLERSIPDSGYKVDHGWPSLPDGHALGVVRAVDIDSHGHIFAFNSFRDWVIPFPEETESEPLILMWDGKDGSLISSWGAATFRICLTWYRIL